MPFSPSAPHFTHKERDRVFDHIEPSLAGPFAEADPDCLSFAELEPEWSAPAEEVVSIAGTDGKRAAELLEVTRKNGLEILQAITAQAIRRLMADPTPLDETTLFNADEIRQLSQSIGIAMAAGDLLGRSRVIRMAQHYESKPDHKALELGFTPYKCATCGGIAYDGDLATGVKFIATTKCAGCNARQPKKSLVPMELDRFAEIHRGDPQPFEVFADPIPPLQPTEAVEYFRRLVPSLTLTADRYGKYLDRQAFTLAVATDETLLDRVKTIIADQLETGQRLDPVGDIQDVLTEIGVSNDNPQYADLVYRTNMMDSYVQGQQRQFASPDMQAEFPAWEYHAIVNERSRPHHAARNGLLYPAEVPFGEVRGTDASEVINCRCGWSPIHRSLLNRRLQQGQRIETIW